MVFLFPGVFSNVMQKSYLNVRIYFIELNMFDSITKKYFFFSALLIPFSEFFNVAAITSLNIVRKKAEEVFLKTVFSMFFIIRIKEN